MSRNRNILVAGEFRWHWYEEAMARALQQLGVTVHRFGWAGYFPRGTWGRFQRWFAWGPSILRLNALLTKRAKSLEPDIVFVQNGNYLRLETVKRLAGSTWLAGYTNDDPFGVNAWRFPWRRLRKTIPHYDSWHVYRPQNIEEFKRAGAKNVEMLMSYYLPWEISEDCLEPRTEFDFDIVFVGHGEPDHRVQFIRLLINAGLSLQIFGDPERWHRCLPARVLRQLPPIREVTHKEYRRIVRRSKICLAFLSRENRDIYTRRCFEIPSWGGFMLAERTPVLQGLYQEGVEAEFFSSAEELVVKCQRYLHRDSLREEIAGRGQNRCLQDGHDVVSRMRQWLEDTHRAMLRMGK